MKVLNNPFDDRTRKQFDAYATQRQYLHVSCCFKVQGDCNEVVHNIDSRVASLSLRFQEDIMRAEAFTYISLTSLTVKFWAMALTMNMTWGLSVATLFLCGKGDDKNQSSVSIRVTCIWKLLCSWLVNHCGFSRSYFFLRIPFYINNNPTISSVLL